MAECDMELPVEYADVIPVKREETSKPGEYDSGISSVPSGRLWTLWPNLFRRVRTLENSNCNSSNEEVIVDYESSSLHQPIEPTVITQGSKESPQEQFVRTNSPTSGHITSLNLKEGQNMVTFIFSTRVLGEQKVESHIYLWKWNTKIVISDVDGTITKSDVLGQFMPLVGKDWTHFGTARLFSAIKENGYQLLFLSARAIVQAYLTKNFLFNLKQDGKTLPTGPVVISPDGLFPSLYIEGKDLAWSMQIIFQLYKTSKHFSRTTTTHFMRASGIGTLMNSVTEKLEFQRQNLYNQPKGGF
ncbi:hypothetical protein K7X08_037671 [Anisodus acutangulus]|uniref:LNS2/PITP domain-containing protein n=1 Tax=Anisodus acutangulus TaxID=402998 RepID=A0A9Q1MWY3_9SOLA|nr:hypothetical protein K7X08_037671 [Anisodus acutangulus]